MNVETGAEAALFPEKEYINGIFFAVHTSTDEKRKSLILTIKTFKKLEVKIYLHTSKTTPHSLHNSVQHFFSEFFFSIFPTVSNASSILVVFYIHNDFL